MRTEKKEIEEGIRLSIFGSVCSVIVGFVLFQFNVFNTSYPAFQFVSFGLAGSILFAVTRAASTQKAFGTLLLLLFLHQLVFQPHGYFMIFRDIVFLSGLFAATWLFVRRFFKRLDDFPLSRPLILGSLFALNGLLASIILQLAQILGKDLGLPFLNSAMYYNLSQEFLIGVGIGSGIELSVIVKQKKKISIGPKVRVFSSLLILICSLSPAQSPYRTSWSKDGIIGGAGLVFGITAAAIDEGIKPLTAQEIGLFSREAVNSFDRPATYNYSENISQTSDVLLILSAAAPLSLFADETVRNDWVSVSTMYVETMIFAASAPSLGKGGVQRARPYVYNPDAPLEQKTGLDARRSFFSGHATVAFSSAVFLSTVYSDFYPGSKWTPYIWAGSLLTASATGFLRFESGQHFPTDILVGAVVGSAIGYLIPAIHKSENGTLGIAPASNGPQTGILLQLRI